MLVLHPRDDNAKESTKPSSIDCIPPSNTGADGTHGSSRRTTRTAPQEDLNAPRRSVQRSFRILTTRVGLSPRSRAFERIQRLRSPVNPPFVYITMWKRVFSFTFRFALASIIETSIVSFGLDPFVLGTVDRTIRFGRRCSTYGWRLIRSSRIEVGLVVEIFAFGTVASSVHLATCWWLRHRLGTPIPLSGIGAI